MNREKLIRITAIIFVFVMILNLLSFAFRLINELLFWLVIIVSAAVAYVFIPQQRE